MSYCGITATIFIMKSYLDENIIEGEPLPRPASKPVSASAPRTYRVRPRSAKSLAWIIPLVLIVAFGCVFAVRYAINYSVAQVKADVLSAEKIELKEGAKKAHPVDLASPLREKTVENVLAGESIPAYTYDDCWSLDVSKPSGVTLADLQLVSKGAFVGIEDAFLKAEQDYGVNCLFVMGIASLESANGTICYRPNNMFGFGGRSFSSKSECVDVVSRALAYNYLSPGGSLYNGTRVTDVNKRYAASSTWDEKVCRNMARYYSVIAPNHNAQLEKLK